MCCVLWLMYITVYLCDAIIDDDHTNVNINMEKIEMMNDINLVTSTLKMNLHIHQYEDYQHKHKKREVNTLKKNTTGEHELTTYFTIEFENKHYIIDLSLNNVLLPNDFSVTTFTETGKKQNFKPNAQEKNHCYYHGVVRGITGSQVIASTCHGFEGVILLPNDYLVIQPLANSSSYMVYRPKVVNDSVSINYCNTSSAYQSPSKQLIENYTDVHQHFDHLKQKQDVKKFLELFIVVDNAAFNKYSTIEAVEDRVKQVVNLVDGYYIKYNVRIVLSHIEIWNDTDKVQISTSSHDAILNFSTYRLQRFANEIPSSPWVYADAIHLLFGHDFNSTTLGVATTSSMCTKNAIGVVQDGGVTTLSGTLTHEIGHNFGLIHTTADCKCREKFQCIMNAYYSPGLPHEWSKCSDNILKKNLQSSLVNCLYNVPREMVEGLRCGNDIVEKGEECDCGLPQHCKSNCCDPRSCKLTHGSMCDAGLCCHNCSLLTSGIMCRNASNECELKEYCDGQSAFCPNNTYKEDGTSCLQGQGACSKGTCLSLDGLCKRVWGKGAVKAPDACYKVLNTAGRAHGHCGRNSTGGYKNCSAEDIHCGVLFCSGGEAKPVFPSNLAVLTLRNPTMTIACKTHGTDDGNPTLIDSGLVLTGTQCGRGKICLGIKCQNIPTLTCTQGCNGKGVCNNFHQCHCNDGWAPPNCNQAGKGGTLQKVTPSTATSSTTSDSSRPTLPVDSSRRTLPSDSSRPTSPSDSSRPALPSNSGSHWKTVLLALSSLIGISLVVFLFYKYGKSRKEIHSYTQMPKNKGPT